MPEASCQLGRGSEWLDGAARRSLAPPRGWAGSWKGGRHEDVSMAVVDVDWVLGGSGLGGTDGSGFAGRGDLPGSGVG